MSSDLEKQELTILSALSQCIRAVHIFIVSSCRNHCLMDFETAECNREAYVNVSCAAGQMQGCLQKRLSWASMQHVSAGSTLPLVLDPLITCAKAVQGPQCSADPHLAGDDVSCWC